MSDNDDDDGLDWTDYLALFVFGVVLSLVIGMIALVIYVGGPE